MLPWGGLGRFLVGTWLPKRGGQVICRHGLSLWHWQWRLKQNVMMRTSSKWFGCASMKHTVLVVQVLKAVCTTSLHQRLLLTSLQEAVGSTAHPKCSHMFECRCTGLCIPSIHIGPYRRG